MANARTFLRPRQGTSSRADTTAARDEIARIAYQLYEQRGRLDGYALEDWLKAEAMVRAQGRRS